MYLCYNEINGTQDLKIFSHTHSLILSPPASFCTFLRLIRLSSLPHQCDPSISCSRHLTACYRHKLSACGLRALRWCLHSSHILSTRLFLSPFAPLSVSTRLCVRVTACVWVTMVWWQVSKTNHILTDLNMMLTRELAGLKTSIQGNCDRLKYLQVQITHL